MEEEIKVNVSSVYEESTPELYMLLQDEFISKEEKSKNEYCYVDLNHTDGSYCDGQPAPIAMIKKMVEDAEAAGSTHIYIDYHCDHIEFDVYGYKLERETNEDIKAREEEEKRKVEDKKIRKIAKLEKELAELKQVKF